MSAFSDRLLLDFLRDDFVTDLVNQLTVPVLFTLVFSPEDIDIEEIALARIRRREFAVPAFETLRIHGTNEVLAANSERTRIERSEPRRGRLAWVDVFLDLDLAAKVSLRVGAVDSITVKNLLDKLGPFNTIPQLRARLAELYPQSIVDAFFARRPITSVAQFKKEPHLFMEIVTKDPPPFDPNDPAAARTFRLTLCVQIQSDVRLVESLQAAKLCRSVMTGAGDPVETRGEYTVTGPYAFLVLFPDASVADGTLPGLTAAQIKTQTRDLFRTEGMLAHFV